MFPYDEMAGTRHAEAAVAHELAAQRHSDAARDHFAENATDAARRSSEAVVSSRAAHRLSSLAGDQTRSVGPDDKTGSRYAWAEGVIAELGGPALLKTILNAELSCDVAIAEMRIFVDHGASSLTALSVRCEIVR
ncbi:MAG TPA: hypothetical protein VGK37_01180 [Casimicrobiaceae bacterium]|jgi:hypothetical protein